VDISRWPNDKPSVVNKHSAARENTCSVGQVARPRCAGHTTCSWSLSALLTTNAHVYFETSRLRRPVKTGAGGGGAIVTGDGGAFAGAGGGGDILSAVGAVVGATVGFVGVAVGGL